MSRVVLGVESLRIEFPTHEGVAVAARDVSFELQEGECLAIVGESGSGKSVTCLGLLNLVPPPGRIADGRIVLDGEDLGALDGEAIRRVRGDRISMIFQDPSAALNPLFTVERQIRDVIAAHKSWSAREIRARVVQVLGEVGFPQPEQRMGSYPHELSGGLKQRVAIAMALACGPRVVLADEPTTNLDVGVQAQIVELLAELKREHGFGIVFVTHDLPLARRIADRIMVMYAGYPVELGPADELLDNPAHPYTIGLLHAAPRGESHDVRRLTAIPGTVPNLATLGGSAPFHSRCPVLVGGVCDRDEPGWTDCGPGHVVACHRFAADGREGTAWTR